MIQIRLMRAEDINQVHEIENKTFSMPWSKIALKESFERPDGIHVVACEEEKVVGYCSLFNIVNEGNINNVAVDKNYRGRQIGFSMLTQLIKIGNEKNIEAYTLEVRRSNTRAIKLYHKLGFKTEGLRKNFYENPKEDALIMWLR